MKRTFGDLETGDIIYYIAWDSQKEKYKVFEHEIVVKNTIDDKSICIDIKLRPGDYISHRITDLCLLRNNTTTTWDSGGNRIYVFSISVDYEDAKKICLACMFKYCEVLIEDASKANDKMKKALEKYGELMNELNK